MELELTYELVHGTDRGGEDVSLGVALTADELPPTEEGVRAAAEAAFDAWLASAPGPDDDAEVYVEDGRVRTYESEYGFSVNRPAEEVRKDVVEAAVTGVRPAVKDKWGGLSHVEWTLKVGSRTYRFETELYRDGNAD